MNYNLDYSRPLSSVFTDGLFRFLVLLLLFIALLFEQKNLILISLLILTMFYGCKLWCRWSAKNIHYSFDAEKKKGFPGETISLQAKIFNNKLLPVWIKLLIPMDSKLIASAGKENFLSEEFSLLWYDHFLGQWKLTAQQRGCFQIGPPFLETGDLLGFFQQRKYLSQAVEVIIYPKLISLNFLAAPVRELFGKPGIDSPVKDPIYPIATCDYQYGEPAKFIHWKASARHNRLQSKVFDSSAQRKTLLIIDVASFPKKGQEELFEKTLEVIAAIIVEFDRQGSPYGILSNGKLVGDNPASLSLGSGPEQLSQAMELLARLQLKATSSVSHILSQEGAIPGGTGCIYCAYRLHRKIIQTAEWLRERHLPLYFMMAKPSRHITCSHLPLFLVDEIHGGVCEANSNFNENHA